MNYTYLTLRRDRDVITIASASAAEWWPRVGARLRRALIASLPPEGAA